MKLIPKSGNLKDYLEESFYVNYSDSTIVDKSESLYRLSENKLEYIEKVFFLFGIPLIIPGIFRGTG
ncbi:MAG: hypothetical protein ACLS76_04715 [Eubacterium callanderi]